MADITTPTKPAPLYECDALRLVAAGSGSLGDVVCVDSSGLAAKADADAVATALVVGIVISVAGNTPKSTYAAGETLSIAPCGSVLSGYASLTPGTPVYLSTNAGALTQTFNGGAAANGDFSAGDFPTIVGVALTATTILVMPKWCTVALTS